MRKSPKIMNSAPRTRVVLTSPETHTKCEWSCGEHGECVDICLGPGPAGHGEPNPQYVWLSLPMELAKKLHAQMQHAIKE